MVIAGFENTSCVIRTSILYLMSSPRVTQKLKAVIAESIRAGKASHPITYEEAKAIPYSQVRRRNGGGPRLTPKPLVVIIL
jgi:cytochrome P450